MHLLFETTYVHFTPPKMLKNKRVRACDSAVGLIQDRIYIHFLCGQK